MSLKDFNFMPKLSKWIRLYARGNLTARSIFALSLIAILNLCAFLVSQDFGLEQNNALNEIQRGRLHLQSLEILKREIYVTQTIASDRQLEKEIDGIINELRRLKDEAPSIWNSKRQRAFFGKIKSQETVELTERIGQYIGNMSEILSQLEVNRPVDRTREATLLFELVGQVRAYEADCDRFIQIYIAELEETLHQYRLIGFIIFAATLMLLLAVGFLVLRPAIVKLERARNARSMFFSKMSHEIRNPMNSIIGMSKILRETKLDGRQQDLLSRLDLSARGLLSFLSNVIEYSYIETNKVRSGLAPIALKNLIEETSASYSFEAFKKGICFLVNLDPNLPKNVISDEVKLRHIILNLIGNAVKFTKVGHVELSLELTKNQEMRITVADTGIGISDENIHKIFEPFEQADPSVRREHGGTGLGLSIVSEYAKDLGAKIEVQSTFGKGTKISIVVPIDETFAQKELELGPELKLEEITLPELIVVIGDHIVSEWVLKNSKLHPTQVSFFKSWREFTQKSPSLGTSPYLLIDADKLSEEEVRVLGNLNWPDILPIGSALLSSQLLMSGALVPFGIALESSCPLFPWSLDFSRFKESQTIEKATKDLRILVCDDSEENRMILSEYLKPYSYNVETVESGPKCLSILKNNKFDILYLDIQMPDMDGLTVAAEIKRNPSRYLEVPFMVAFTAHTDFYEKQEMMKVGFKHILNKPITASDVKESIVVHQRVTNTMDLIMNGHPESQRPQVISPANKDDSDESMDARIKRKMAAKKGEYLEGQIGTLEKIITEDAANIEALKHYAHKLKGNAAYFEFQDAAVMASDLEVACEQAKGESAQVELASKLANSLLENLKEKRAEL